MPNKKCPKSTKSKLGSDRAMDDKCKGSPRKKGESMAVMSKLMDQELGNQLNPKKKK